MISHSASNGARVAAVVGGSGGIGRAIVRQLRNAGVHTINLDVAEVDESDALYCDVRDAGSVDGAFAQISRECGRLDDVVYCAGVSRNSVLWKMTAAEWDLIHDVNLRGAFLVLRAAIPLMRESGGGHIVLIGSINGTRGKRGTAAYSASKAGIAGLAKSVAREVGSFGISVNVVEPGWVRTPMTEALPEEVRSAALAETLLGEFTECDDIASAVAFLCSDGARHITGQTLRVDSGQLIS